MLFWLRLTILLPISLPMKFPQTFMFMYLCSSYMILLKNYCTLHIISSVFSIRYLYFFQPPSISERCRTVNYTVVLVSSTGERVDQRTISSDSCIEDLCSTSFSPSSSDQTYHVSVNVINVFGESNSTSSMTFSKISVLLLFYMKNT